MYYYFYIIYLTSVTVIFCNKTSNKLIRNFRKNVEEIPNNSYEEKENNSFVSFLVNNIKDIFNEDEERTSTVSIRPKNNTFSNGPQTNTDVTPTLSGLNLNNTVQEKGKRASGNEIEHIYNKFVNQNMKVYESSTKANASFNLSKHIRTLQKKREGVNQIKLGELPLFKMRLLNDSRTTCILCNNVDTIECNNPKNKMMLSITCESEGDQCYSLHTPFGIVDRGCININNNITTYVCSCNLCNYISISELPHIFSTRKDWIKNIIELSRSKHLRRSILKDMSCLSCEVNVHPTKTEDALDIANCLEGNIATLPIQECAENEICGVKAIRSKGYVWRGCVTSPLYNYWWTICDTDLCNYDTVGFVYDEFH